ncbi:MAG: excinuclease ABC subunit C, partial [Deferribacteres bacterium]|nr:excinuclease ABC subunit C [Deferribacteres bacterium]
SSLRSRMQQLSDEQRFEEAAAVRDSLIAIEKAWESQRVTAPELGDMDVIGLYREEKEASVFILFIRNGAVIGQKDFFLRKLGDMPDKEIVAGFMEQFYLKEMLIPPKIIIPVKARLSTQRQWLSRKRGGPVQVGPAKSAEEEKVLNMANENAFYSFRRHRDTAPDETLHEVKRLLGLETVPERISAVDVSNISGSEAVGAVVVYEKGKFRKEGYRLFRIKTVDGINDFAMIGEVVGRYLKGFLEDGDSLPQLILVDGGRGQLEAAMNVMRDSGLAVEIAAIAKARDAEPDREGLIRTDVDRIYLPGRTGPVYLEPFLASTHLLQKIRDEAHRFAVSYHKKLRTKRTLESPLEKIKGIGKKRRLLLLRHFGSIEAIRKASIEEIASLKGMNKKIAGELKEALK